MPEQKSRFQRAIDFLNRPPERYTNDLTRQLDNASFKRDINLDPDRVDLNGPVYGYNTNAGYYPNTNDVGDGTGNSAVVACLEILSTSFSEPSLEVYSLDDETNQYEIVNNHPLAKLMKRPNPYITGELMNSYLMYSLHSNGDAYIFKRRSAAGRVVELHPIMPFMITPRGNTKNLITHYDYELPDGKVIIKKEDMIHVRLNIDPADHRRGRAPLKNVLREIMGDEAAGQFATALLSNMGVPGVILSPKGGDEMFGGPTREQAEQIAEAYKTKFGGANRGAPMVLSGPMDVDVVSFSPEQLNLNELRRVPEERISAVLGVPAILAGLGAGLESATYSNARELREFFTENKLSPLWRIIANEYTHQLLYADFTDDEKLIAKYDLTNVKSMQEDRANLIKSMDIGVKGGWVSIAEARQAIGLPTNESHNIYLRSLQWDEQTGDTDGLGSNYEGEDNDDKPKPTEEQLVPDTVLDALDATDTTDIPKPDGKVLSTDTFPVESERTDEIIGTPTRLDKPKATVDVFETEEQALLRARELGCEGTHTHDHDGNIMYMPCSTHEIYESVADKKPESLEYGGKIKLGEQFFKDFMKEFEQEVDILIYEKAAGDPATRNAGGPKLKPGDITNFPEKGDDKAIRLSNSKHKRFSDHAFVMKLKNDYPTLWRRAGTGGNPPTAFTGNDAFRNWTKYRNGDRSTAVLAWVRRRELYINRHTGDFRLNGAIAMMEWGGVLSGGEGKMKEVVREAMKKIDDRKK